MTKSCISSDMLRSINIKELDLTNSILHNNTAVQIIKIFKDIQKIRPLTKEEIVELDYANEFYSSIRPQIASLNDKKIALEKAIKSKEASERKKIKKQKEIEFKTSMTKFIFDQKPKYYQVINDLKTLLREFLSLPWLVKRESSINSDIEQLLNANFDGEEISFHLLHKISELKLLPSYDCMTGKKLDDFDSLTQFNNLLPKMKYTIEQLYLYCYNPKHFVEQSDDRSGIKLTVPIPKPYHDWIYKCHLCGDRQYSSCSQF